MKNIYLIIAFLAFFCAFFFDDPVSSIEMYVLGMGSFILHELQIIREKQLSGIHLNSYIEIKPEETKKSMAKKKSVSKKVKSKSKKK